MDSKDRVALGRLERRPAREAWLNEASEFMPWLADNLDVLGGELGLALTLRSREHRVGHYWLDLLLEDERGRTVVVENQFGGGDHDHLGKLLTYAAGTKADVVIWLAESFGEEQVAALEWLNQNTLPGVGFFGVEFELLRIGQEHAPHFRVVVRPNEWVQEVRRETRARLEWDWEAYKRDLGLSDERIAIGRALVEKLEAATSERELPWQIQFRKGYVALQRSGGYNVAVVDMYWRAPPRFAVKVPSAPESLGLANPFAGLKADWNERDYEWGWTIQSLGAVPDVGAALDLARPFHPTSGAMVTP